MKNLKKPMKNTLFHDFSMNLAKTLIKNGSKKSQTLKIEICHLVKIDEWTHPHTDIPKPNRNKLSGLKNLSKFKKIIKIHKNLLKTIKFDQN